MVIGRYIRIDGRKLLSCCLIVIIVVIVLVCLIGVWIMMLLLMDFENVGVFVKFMKNDKS